MAPQKIVHDEVQTIAAAVQKHLIGRMFSAETLAKVKALAASAK